MSFFGINFGGKKAEEPEPDPSSPASATPYHIPFPLTGETVEDAKRLYTCASKTDCFMFRQLADDVAGFTLRYDSNGVVVWDRKLPGEAMSVIKIFSTFDCTPEEMWDMLHDPVYRAVWDAARIDSFRITLLNPNNDIGYYAGTAPTGIGNRDFLNQRTWHNAGDGEFVIFNTSVLHRKCPEKKGFVRAVSKLSGYLVRKWGDGGCSLTYLTQTDPKGWIPSSVVNYITTRFGPSMMQKMHTAASEYRAWRAAQGDGWFKDWEAAADPWDAETENKTHEFIAERRRMGIGAPSVVPQTPASDGGATPILNNGDSGAGSPVTPGDQSEASGSPQLFT